MLIFYICLCTIYSDIFFFNLIQYHNRAQYSSNNFYTKKKNKNKTTVKSVKKNINKQHEFFRYLCSRLKQCLIQIIFVWIAVLMRNIF